MPTTRPASRSLAELASIAGAALEGDGDIAIDAVGTLEAAGPGAIAFLANPKYRTELAATRASAVIVAPNDAALTPLPKLVTPNPYAAYARVAAALAPPREHTPGVHASAVVAGDATIAPDAAIGAHVFIGARAVVAARAVVGPGCVVDEDVWIGEDATLVARVAVYARCRIGPRTVIHAGAVIGADGFGMAEEEGRWVRIPQLGRVVIGADCEVGANTTIDRGAIGDTVLEDDVKLDNQIQVGHNCVIGRHTAIAGCSGIAGSTRIGRNCKIAGGVGIAGHLTIADNVVIGAGTAIVTSIPEPGMYTGLFPSLPHRDWRVVAAQLRHLPEFVRRLRRLERVSDDPPSGDRT